MKQSVSSTPVKAGLNGASSKPASPDTVRKMSHRKSSSYQPISVNVSSHKSRFDIGFIPSVSVDCLSAKKETVKICLASRNSELEDKRRRCLEWSAAKKDMKKTVENEIKEDEYRKTVERLAFNQNLKVSQESWKKLVKKDKIQDFVEFSNARKQLRLKEKLKESEDLKVEREKSMKKQSEISDKKRVLHEEREEKRKSFLEFLEAKKKFKETEKIREAKEFQYESMIKVLEDKNLAHFKSIS